MLCSCHLLLKKLKRVLLSLVVEESLAATHPAATSLVEESLAATHAAATHLVEESLAGTHAAATHLAHVLNTLMVCSIPDFLDVPHATAGATQLHTAAHAPHQQPSTQYPAPAPALHLALPNMYTPATNLTPRQRIRFIGDEKERFHELMTTMLPSISAAAAAAAAACVRAPSPPPPPFD